MAQKTDIAAEKARKQKIVLAVIGALLVAIAAIQVPKLMKGDSAPAAAPAAETTPAAASAGSATTTAAAVTTTVVSTPTAKPVAFVAGVGLPGTRHVAAAKSQLASFTLFPANDPFVQQVGDDDGSPSTTAAPAAQPSSDKPATAGPTAVPGAGGTPSSDAGSSASDSAPQAPVAVTYATVMLDGKPQQLQVKEKFPKADPMFVLVSLKKKKAQIGVAGGSFDDGQTVTLVLGKKLTLLNTATGVRYELRLIYTGSQPEVIEGFSTKADQQATTGGSSTSGSSTASTTAP